MRIGVDATSWFNERGYGRFTRELLRAMVLEGADHEFLCWVDQRDVEQFDLRGDHVRACGVELSARPAEAASSDGSRSVPDMMRMTRAVRAERPDVLFYPTVYSFFPAPLRQRAVVAVHDVIAERFPRLTLPSARARLFWKIKVWLALRQADLVLTVSDYSARQIERVLGVPQSRLRATHEAPAPTFRPGSEAEVAAAMERVGLPAGAKYFTYVGGFNPHKNVDVLVRAHGALVSELGEPVHLVLVGTLQRDVFYSGVEAIRAAIREQGTDHLVHWPGFVADDELRLLHSGARGLVLASEMEGFGLPAAEAAACGTPMVATTESPLPDLFEGGGFFVAPRDHNALLGAMRTLANDDDVRSARGARALECARALTWSSAARVALGVLEEAAR